MEIQTGKLIQTASQLDYPNLGSGRFNKANAKEIGTFFTKVINHHFPGVLLGSNLPDENVADPFVRLAVGLGEDQPNRKIFAPFYRAKRVIEALKENNIPSDHKVVALVIGCYLINFTEEDLLQVIKNRDLEASKKEKVAIPRWEHQTRLKNELNRYFRGNEVAINAFWAACSTFTEFAARYHRARQKNGNRKSTIFSKESWRLIVGQVWRRAVTAAINNEFYKLENLALILGAVIPAVMPVAERDRLKNPLTSPLKTTGMLTMHKLFPDIITERKLKNFLSRDRGKKALAKAARSARRLTALLEKPEVRNTLTKTQLRAAQAMIRTIANPEKLTLPLEP